MSTVRVHRIYDSNEVSGLFQSRITRRKRQGTAQYVLLERVSGDSIQAVDIMVLWTIMLILLVGQKPCTHTHQKKPPKVQIAVKEDS